MKGPVPIEKLDELLEWFDEGRHSLGIDEAYRRFNDVWMTHPTDLPADPFSPEYAERYFEIYRRVSGRSSYDPAENERAVFDPEAGALRPFPFQGGSTKLAGEHLGYMARLLDMLEVPPGGEVLEMGVGWGNTTIALAMLDLKVTALDIEERYLEVIRRRAFTNQVNIELVHSDFLWVERCDREFDAVIFFESFHHSKEFFRLLSALHQVVKPGGKVYFAAEPINRYFDQPWCVRLDGQSLLVARRNGWMELGFHSDFFAELLSRTGWLGLEQDHPHFWVAQRKTDPLIFAASDQRVQFSSAARFGGVIEIDVPLAHGASYVIFGPGADLPPGRHRAVINMSIHNAPSSFVIDACFDQGRHILGSEVGKTSLGFELSSRAEDVEVRLLASGGFRATVEGVAFVTMT